MNDSRTEFNGTPPPSNADQLDDHELVRLTGLGDRRAFAILVRRHQSRVIALAHRFLGGSDAAEDVAQDAFIRVFQSAPGYRPTAKFTTWLYRIVANLCWDARRRRSRPEQMVPPEDRPTPAADESLERAERQLTIRRAVADLPDRQRLVIILHRFEDLGHAEIAEITGWSQSAVESCLVRAYATLRTRLAGLGVDPKPGFSAGTADPERSTNEETT